MILHAFPPLTRARLIKRYKRFLADVVLLDGPRAGEEVTIHCPNPGAMTGLAEPDWTIHLAPGKGKLPYSWELTELPDGHFAGINTGHPNRIAEAAIKADLIPDLGGYPSLRREVRYGVNSRIDLLAEAPDRPPCYIEVKNVHLLRQPGLAEFPDCVTARGAKHLFELAAQVKAGARAVMLYIVQRDDCDAFALAADIDPAYARAFAEARQAGVEALVYGCTLSPDGVRLRSRLPLVTARGDAYV
ncbi:DNA/RNA nuclease SfsA [Elstera cyanobacteriorum]|uniref:DNA/RNA nuclease SfsA n=1 Tax=Elstera cyanobacteriorum TaxID=2022747 RepID=UPI0023546BFC|nr:DNA/RNA nuclease SfsA [Elstera cyanobacteriorum]MCK6443876.1 DNA/RNA nuclease SfsA [Elstera cyanobacteriorum]